MLRKFFAALALTASSFGILSAQDFDTLRKAEPVVAPVPAPKGAYLTDLVVFRMAQMGGEALASGKDGFGCLYGASQKNVLVVSTIATILDTSGVDLTDPFGTCGRVASPYLSKELADSVSASILGLVGYVHTHVDLTSRHSVNQKLGKKVSGSIESFVYSTPGPEDVKAAEEIEKSVGHPIVSCIISPAKEQDGDWARPITFRAFCSYRGSGQFVSLEEPKKKA